MLEPTKKINLKTRANQNFWFENHWDTRKGKKVGWASASTKKSKKIVSQAKNKWWYCKRAKKVCIIEIAREK